MLKKSLRKKGQRTRLAKANVYKAVGGKNALPCRYPYSPQPSVQRQSVTERASVVVCVGLGRFSGRSVIGRL